MNNNIGKKVGTAIYFHKQYLCSMKHDIVQEVRNAISSYIRGGTIFQKIDIIRVDKDSISFIEIDNFDKKINPAVKCVYRFKKHKNYWKFIDKKKGCVVNPTIIHQKELMVGDDYKGFSKSLAEEWTSIIEKSTLKVTQDRRKITKRKYWNDCIKKIELVHFELINNFKYNWNNQFI